MIILTLFIFMFMLVMAGLGIDSMRHEMHRAHLQATLDSAVLAGAGASTDEEAKHVVEDYFAKAGMSEYLNAIGEDDIDIGLNSASVTASASFDMDTYLMKLSGVDRLSASAEATAVTRVPKLEIALVLDVSNSMNQYGTNRKTKMENLRKAAKEFVTTIINSADPGNATISIVPFSTSVAPSDEIFDAMLVDQTHRRSNCLVFDDDDYHGTALATDAAANNDLSLVPMKQAIYTSRYGTFDNLNKSWRSCYTEDGYRIMQFSTSESDLHAKIDGMMADGNTTGSLGVKWGAALLDPSFRDVTGTVVPVDYSDSETMKIIVMMGDGENTTTFFFPEDSDYRGPDSDLYKAEFSYQKFKYAYRTWNENRRYYDDRYQWRCDRSDYECEYENVTESTYYLRDPDRYYSYGRYTDDTLDDWYYYNINERDWLNGSEFAEIPDQEGYENLERLSWEEAWGMMSPREYGDITGIYDAYYEYENTSSNVTGSQKNTRMDNVCAAAKNNGVVIYTIGYEVPKNGTAETSLKKCATGYDPNEGNTAYYYSVDGLDISDAFGSIAGNVQALRLTQ